MLKNVLKEFPREQHIYSLTGEIYFGYGNNANLQERLSVISFFQLMELHFPRSKL